MMREGMSEALIRADIVKGTYRRMFTVDYSQEDFFVCENSFCLLDWMITEKIINDKTFDFSDIDSVMLIRMNFNTFPRMRSLLHLNALNTAALDLDLMEFIFDLAKDGIEDIRENVAC